MKTIKRTNMVPITVTLPKSKVLELDEMIDHSIDNRARRLRIFILDGIEKMKNEKKVFDNKK